MAVFSSREGWFPLWSLTTLQAAVWNMDVEQRCSFCLEPGCPSIYVARSIATVVLDAAPSPSIAPILAGRGEKGKRTQFALLCLCFLIWELADLFNFD
jgi:hypothetical protein